MSKLRADITYSHRLNSNNIIPDFVISETDINITDIDINSMEKNNEILIENDSDSDDKYDQINIENQFGEYL